MNRVYCWGDNEFGQIGNGTHSRRLTPIAVVGGLKFTQLSLGGWHACGWTPEAVAYCWGGGGFGQLGNGSTADETRPVAVSGP